MVAILDYGLGNIRAFANIYKNLNIPHKIASKVQELQDTDRIILPGVGAFDQAMTLLNTSGMREALDDLVLAKKLPVLGICIGMQILACSSEEGSLPGLGWIDGTVKKVNVTGLDHKPLLPHMGWNTVISTSQNRLLEGFSGGGRFYFLHSYCFHCNKPGDAIAEVNYGGRFTCAVNSGNVFGVQFHPEKSHQNGIMLLKNFGTI